MYLLKFLYKYILYTEYMPPLLPSSPLSLHLLVPFAPLASFALISVLYTHTHFYVFVWNLEAQVRESMTYLFFSDWCNSLNTILSY